MNQDSILATVARLKPGALVAALAAASLLTLAMPAHAQSDSSLFSVGSAPARSTPKASPSKPAGTKPAAARPAASKPVAGKPAPANRARAARSTDRQANRNAGKNNAARKSAATQRGSAPRPLGPAALNGRWQEPTCAPLASARVTEPLFIKRQYQFDDRKKGWQLEAAVFADAHCLATSRMLTFRGEGSYSLKGATRTASNDWNADFRIDGWQATPASREGVMALLNARCGRGEFAAGKPIDLSRTGCAPLGIEPIAQRPSERERVRIADGKVTVGASSLLPASHGDQPAQISRVGMPQAAN